MRSVTVALLAAIFLALVPIPGRAMDGCDSNGLPALGILDTGVGFYVDDPAYGPQGLAVYEETNGQAGLQRGGASPIFGPDPCMSTDPDTQPDMRVL